MASKRFASNFVRVYPHTGVRGVRIVRRVRAPSAWRESAPSVVRRARSAPALRPQPSPAPRLANIRTGRVNSSHSHRSSFKYFACSDTSFSGATRRSSHFLVAVPLAVCQMTNRRAAVTRWTARRPQMPLATATVPSWNDAS